MLMAKLIEPPCSSVLIQTYVKTSTKWGILVQTKVKTSANWGNVERWTSLMHPVTPPPRVRKNSKNCWKGLGGRYLVGKID